MRCKLTVLYSRGVKIIPQPLPQLADITMHPSDCWLTAHTEYKNEPLILEHCRLASIGPNSIVFEGEDIEVIIDDYKDYYKQVWIVAPIGEPKVSRV